MKFQDNVRAVVVKEVQLRDPVLTGALHCYSRASPSTSSPTFNCPLPRLRRPPADLNAATTDRDCDPSGSRSSANGLWAMGPGPADLNAASTNKDCDPSGAPLVGQRTMGPGPGLVAHVLWRYCMRLASSGVGDVRRVRLAFGRHPMPDAPPPHTSTNIQ